MWLVSLELTYSHSRRLRLKFCANRSVFTVKFKHTIPYSYSGLKSVFRSVLKSGDVFQTQSTQNCFAGRLKLCPGVWDKS